MDTFEISNLEHKLIFIAVSELVMIVFSIFPTASLIPKASFAFLILHLLNSMYPPTILKPSHISPSISGKNSTPSFFPSIISFPSHWINASLPK